MQWMTDAVLDRGPVADHDAAVVAPEHGLGPNRGLGADRHVADDGRLAGARRPPDGSGAPRRRAHRSAIEAESTGSRLGKGSTGASGDAPISAFMATTEPGISPPATTSEVGRHLRTVRKAKGLSRAEVARSAGLTRRELAAYERGRIPVPDSDLWCLAGSCGVDVSELLPSRDKLNVGTRPRLADGRRQRSLASGRAPSATGSLREYLAMIYELRNLPPGTRPPMREEDLAALADSARWNARGDRSPPRTS